MKIDVEITRQTVEVDIDFDEFMAQAFYKDVNESNLQKVNSIAGLLKEIPDSAIEKSTDQQRETIAKFLIKQAARYAPAMSA